MGYRREGCLRPNDLVRQMLEARGEVLHSMGDDGDVQLLRSRSAVGLSFNSYDERLLSYTFRRLLHELTEKCMGSPRFPTDLAESIGCHNLGKLDDYLSILEEHGIAERIRDGWRIAG